PPPRSKTLSTPPGSSFRNSKSKDQARHALPANLARVGGLAPPARALWPCAPVGGRRYTSHRSTLSAARSPRQMPDRAQWPLRKVHRWRRHLLLTPPCGHAPGRADTVSKLQDLWWALLQDALFLPAPALL